MERKAVLMRGFVPLCDVCMSTLLAVTVALRQVIQHQNDTELKTSI